MRKVYEIMNLTESYASLPVAVDYTNSEIKKGMLEKFWGDDVKKLFTRNKGKARILR